MGVELSARHQPPCHGLATVNVIEITAFAAGIHLAACRKPHQRPLLSKRGALRPKGKNWHEQ